MSGDQSPGILLFAHGARDPHWARPFEAVRERVRAALPGRPVELAFLEFMAPDLLEAGARLAPQCAEVVVVPLFLGAGGHVRKDVPALLEQLAAKHPATAFRLAGAAGEHPLVIKALADAALALARTPT